MAYYPIINDDDADLVLYPECDDPGAVENSPSKRLDYKSNQIMLEKGRKMLILDCPTR